MITGGDLRQSRLDVGYKTFTISPWETEAFETPANCAISSILTILNSSFILMLNNLNDVVKMW
jgi:hypothetical protein